MNHRVLELLKTPKNIQSEDIDLLKEEINSFPYVQNIRALYLYGVHLYDRDNYQKVLSTTAAYTTDKKILYQLINGKIQERPKPEIKPEMVKEKSIPKENPLSLLQKSKASGFPIKREEVPVAEVQPEILEEPKEKVPERKLENYILPAPKQEIKHLYVDGERNRILFEGEENFLDDEDVERIDLESTLESGSIVTQKIEKKQEPINAEENIQEEETPTENKEAEVVDEIQEFTPETVIEEEKITSEPEKEEILNESDVSFHETESLDDEIENAGDEVQEEVTESKTVVDESENLGLNKTEETAEFTSETVIEEEKITSEPEKEEILNKSDVSFHETESLDTEIEDAGNEVQEEVAESETVVDKSENSDTNKTAEFTPEKIINEDQISSEKEEKSVQDESELSFHGMESFLPEVKIQVNNSEEALSETPQSIINKHEDEMRRLIEEVEKKMKEKAVSEKNKEEEPENTSHDISFAETQSFEVKPTEPEVKEESNEESSTEEVQIETVEAPQAEQISEEPTDIKSAWKPMSLESNVPDSLLHKPVEIPQPKVDDKAQKIEVSQTETQKRKGFLDRIKEVDESDEEQNDEETPKSVDENRENGRVMNVSFFGADILKWNVAESKKEEEKVEIKEEIKENPVQKTVTNSINSNIPGFINTWQSWLKIDRNR
ncbi:hypothetical protein J3D55_000576 [Chryseobacterium ginsenosidimutans]|uniref:hypothetical protein n=1 Tax=Chryseobacterium ginsenosidimutans TaxID=687846 RepID=UPI0021671642|nr:hypothetical protein [Chryseobacterium ginsenosidimutans]MCS3867660.1 hypothetical protein [Chryseobacterium ginsenosidimutans]